MTRLISTTEKTARPSALEMFRMGNDYLQIAAYFKSSEAEVEKLIHLLRSRERIAIQKADWQEKRKEERKAYMRRQPCWKSTGEGAAMNERISSAQLKQLAERPKKQPKYRNKKVMIDGRTFDSIKEGKRYQELKLLEKAGHISHLECQPRFKLFCGTTPILYDSGRQATYVADFAYFDGERRVIEDAKGFRTPEYKLKRAIVHAMHPMTKIVEV